MHNNSFDLSVAEISKIEGNAGLDVKVKNGKVETLELKLADYKRFYTQAVRGKPAVAVPQLVSRICGTCSNAHLLCSIEAVEKGLGINPSAQTRLLRSLIYNGLIIRDHALHLYVFSLPDVVGRDSILAFSENDSREHQLLHDTFEVKAAGNQLSIAFGGRSVHAPYPLVGGFNHFPQAEEIEKSLQMLTKARPAVIRLIDEFLNCPFEFLDNTRFLAIRGTNYNYLEGQVVNSDGEATAEEEIINSLERVEKPYSQASAYQFKGESYMVGALARINISKDLLHPHTQRDAAAALSRFPSRNVYHNNLAQAIEILQAIDESLAILGAQPKYQAEAPAVSTQSDGLGVGVIEAPRGLLLHKYSIESGKVTTAQIIVPTGQNQINMEQNLVQLIEGNLEKTKEQLSFEIEKFIRAYDPCISCATHFLKINWR